MNYCFMQWNIEFHDRAPALPELTGQIAVDAASRQWLLCDAEQPMADTIFDARWKDRSGSRCTYRDPLDPAEELPRNRTGRIALLARRREGKG
jgi:hypothetical protein